MRKLIGVKCTVQPRRECREIVVYPHGVRGYRIGGTFVPISPFAYWRFQKGRLALFLSLAKQFDVPVVELGYGDGYQDWLATGDVESLRPLMDVLASLGLAEPHTSIFAADESLARDAHKAYRARWPEEVEVPDWDELRPDGGRLDEEAV